jgi:hypothetical protein
MTAIILVFYFTRLMGASALPATMQETSIKLMTGGSHDPGRDPIGQGEPFGNPNG